MRGWGLGTLEGVEGGCAPPACRAEALVAAGIYHLNARAPVRPLPPAVITDTPGTHQP